MGRPWPESAERSHVDNFGLNSSSSLSPWTPHPLQGFPRDQKGCPGVGSEDRVPLADRQLLEFNGFVIRRVVHQDVDTAKFAACLPHHGADAGFIGQVTVKGEG